MMGNEPSNLSRLPWGKGTHAWVDADPKPTVGMLLGQQGCGQGAYRGHPSPGSLTGLGHPSAQLPVSEPGCVRGQEGTTCPPVATFIPSSLALVVLRTFYLQGLSRADSAAWYADIQASAGGRGNALRDQQLSRGDIPIIVDSCIAFITQYGEPSAAVAQPQHPPVHTGQPTVHGARGIALGAPGPAGDSLARIGPSCDPMSPRQGCGTRAFTARTEPSPGSRY